MRAGTGSSNAILRKIRTTPLFQYWKCRYLVLLLIPGIAYFFIFYYIPMYGIQIAFKDYFFRRGIWGSPWVGLKHFATLFSMGSFYEVFRNTIFISLLKLVFGFPAPILLALFINEIKASWYKRTVQTISYLPHFVSWVILGGLFIQFLSPTVGPVNIVLKGLGLEPVYFLANVHWFRPVLVMTSIWKGIGWGTIIYLAALAGINIEMYESAIIDGASRLKQALYITLPSMIPVITITFIFSVGSLVQDDFDQIFNLYNPAVYSVGDVMSTYIYRRGLEGMEYSFATAAGLFSNIISFTLIFITNAVTKRINEYGIW